MHYELIYDAVTMSEAPASTLMFGLGAAGLAALWTGWLKWRGHALHWGVKWMGLVALLMLAISLLSLYEQHYIAVRTDVRTVEGPVMGYWTKRERTRNSSGSYSTTEWEGFSVNETAFVYPKNVEQNYFHNSGRTAMKLEDGVYLRLRYVPGDNNIIRVERGAR